ncbi:MAG: DUF1232 domain-containing protein [Desulfobulbaceae bacterium]|nr:DUF1232 domain-containing protein [Desulfobulbaceae bacterium]
MNAVAAKVLYYIKLLFNRRTPWYVRLLLALGLIYLFVPTDFIPDYVPWFGFVDDVTIGTILISLAIRLLPESMRRNK